MHQLSVLTRISILFIIIGVGVFFSGRYFRYFPVSDPLPVGETPASKLHNFLPRYLDLPLPEISARHVFIMDRKSKIVLYAKSADTEVYPASTTKMMTAIVAYEHLPLDQIIMVNHAYPEGVDIGLTPGEQLSVSDLLYAILVQSANDAAEVLAEGFPGGREAFVAVMNARAARMNLRHTVFKNPTGLDQPDHYSSAADLARIADRLIQIPYLANIVSTENAVISSVDYSTRHTLSNVNRLLGRVDGVIGVKTGFTDLAGESLVTRVNRSHGDIIISLLGSSDRFGDTQRLIDWVYSAFAW